MSNAWGQLSWNAGLWGNQSDAIAAPTGLGLNSAQGTTAGYPFPGWGSVEWGSGQFGNIPDFTVEVTGQQSNTNLGNVGISGEVNSGWGGSEWGENGWGIFGDVLVTGIGLSAGVGTGSVTIDVQPELVGQQQNLSVGDPEINITVEVFLRENPLPNLTISEGTVDAAPDAEITGQQQNLSTGNLEAFNSEGWGRSFWGQEVWGASGIWASVPVTGEQLNISQGEETAFTDVTFDITGQELTVEEGIVDPSPDATVVGIGLSASVAVGSVVEADANVVITNAPSTEFNAQGNAALSTDQAKFGVSSLELDGTDDSVDSTTNLNLSSTDFTIDVWIRPNSVSGYKGIWQSGTSTTMQSYLLGNAVYWTVAPSTIITTAVTVNANEWTMLSYERQGNTHRIYKNGTLADTATTANKQDNGLFTIGKNGFGDFNGYIDEFRVSNIARYGGSSFTEPTSEFSVDANTLALLHFDGADGSTDMVNSIPLPIALGTNQGQAELDAVTFVEVTGQGLEVGLRDVTPGASAETFPTGIGLTVSINSINVQSWQIVDTGTNVNWNDIDTAA